MKLFSVSLMVANRVFATIAVGKKNGIPTLRVNYTAGTQVDIDLTVGGTIVIGTTRYNVKLSSCGVRLTKIRGAIKFFHESIVW